MEESLKTMILVKKDNISSRELILGCFGFDRFVRACFRYRCSRQDEEERRTDSRCRLDRDASAMAVDDTRNDTAEPQGDTAHATLAAVGHDVDIAFAAVRHNGAEIDAELLVLPHGDRDQAPCGCCS